jgi:hypothetical protein
LRYLLGNRYVAFHVRVSFTVGQHLDRMDGPCLRVTGPWLWVSGLAGYSSVIIGLSSDVPD